MIYCVEDDQNIRELVVYTLQMTGFETCGFANGRAFFNGLSQELPDLVLLDIMLPDEDGIEILKKLRASSATKELPVIMLTAKGAEYDKVIGLDSGADDYITKPFGMMELISRIKAVLRRSTPKTVLSELAAGGITINVDRHLVVVNGEEIHLTLKEFELLRYLMENQGIVITRDQILENVWGYEFDGETRTVDVHIRALRQKLQERGKSIETVRGVGYRFGDVQ
jgi:two-component system alkaline phosphatase synthesis response regulator PhoP